MTSGKRYREIEEILSIVQECRNLAGYLIDDVHEDDHVITRQVLDDIWKNLDDLLPRINELKKDE